MAEGEWTKFGRRYKTDLARNTILGVIADALERIAYSLEADQRKQQAVHKIMKRVSNVGLRDE